MKKSWALPQIVFQIASSLHDQEVELVSKIDNDGDRWRVLVRCILSSQVAWKSAVLATETVLTQVEFSTTRDSEDLANDIRGALKKARHRFPESRARQIASNWWIWRNVLERLPSRQDFESENEARLVLIDRVKGLGPKQASMFLRDIGAARHLAVIDAHVLVFLKVCEGRAFDVTTLREYLVVEALFRRLAEEWAMSLERLDRAVWLVSRSTRSGHVSA